MAGKIVRETGGGGSSTGFANNYDAIAKSYSSKGDTAMARRFQQLADDARAKSNSSSSTPKSSSSSSSSSRNPFGAAGFALGSLGSALGAISPTLGNTVGTVLKDVGKTVSNPLTPTLVRQQQELEEARQQRAQLDAWKAEQEAAQQAMYQQMYNQIQGIFDSQGQQQQAMMAQLEAQARRQAEEIANQKKSGLNSLIEQLKQTQQSGLMGIANNVEDAKLSVEDQTFQNWLAARQQMSDRGLAGSGLASDQDTRLLLQKQRDLSGVYRDANRARFDLEGRVGSQLDQAYRDLSGINEGDIYADQFAQLYQQGRAGLTDQAKIYADLFKSILPYERMSMSDMANWQGSPLDWAKLAVDNNYNLGRLSNEQQQLALDQSKYILETQKVNLAQLNAAGLTYDPANPGKLIPTLERTNSEWDRILKQAGILGWMKDAKGNIVLTEEARSNQANEYLRGQELAAQIQQWTQQDQLNARARDLNEQEFAWKMQNDQAMLKLAEAELRDSQDRIYMQNQRARLNEIGQEMRSIRDNNPRYASDQYYQTLEQNYNIVFSDLGQKVPSMDFHTDAGTSQGVRRGAFDRYLQWQQ